MTFPAPAGTPPRAFAADDPTQLRLLETQALLDRIVARADACLAGLDARARLQRRVRAAARRRATFAA